MKSGRHLKTSIFPFKTFSDLFVEKMLNKENSKKISGEGKKDKKLKIIHWNCNGIVGHEKFNRLENLLRFEKHDILSLNETKTNATTSCYLFELAKNGYISIYKNRKNESGEENSHGGGVALLIKDSLISKEISFKDGLDQLELVGAEVSMGGKNITII